MKPTKLFLFLLVVLCAIASGTSFRPTQTMSYLEYHKTDKKLGKFYIYIHAAHKEQLHRNTHVPVYFSLNFEDFVQYLFNYIHEVQHGSTHSKVSAFLRLAQERSLCGYLSCFQAIKSPRFKSLPSLSLYDVADANGYKAGNIADTFTSAISSELRTWRKGVVVQMLIPQEYADVLRFTADVGMSVYDMYSKMYNNLTEAPQVGYNCEDLTNVCDLSGDVHVTCFAPGVSQDTEDYVYTKLKHMLGNLHSVYVSQKYV